MSLFDDIKDTAAGRELSIRWYQSRIGDLEGRYLTAPSLIDEGISEERVTSRPTYWMMNMFRYFPLKGERLPYWDLYPLVLPLQRRSDGFIGLNFHYLPIAQRIKVLDRMKMYGVERTGRMKVSFPMIVDWKGVKQMTRRYKAKRVKSLFLQIPLEDMLIGALLPVQRFYTGSYGAKKRIKDEIVYREQRRIYQNA
jgi:hypothetical protein|tara:strand:- start:66 stop:653 length:588 start_codon:yes stop_codon:yes gene_type:complete